MGILSQYDQLVIFKGIIEGVDMLARKFGYFGVNKDMVGYNHSKRGKAWIHENYCVNVVLNKKSITEKERGKWEREIVESLIDICKLSSVDRNTKNCKFPYVIDLIKRQKLYNFNAFCQHP